MGGRILARAGLCLLLLGSPLSGAPEAKTTKEYLIKAAFLYNFAKFIEWPPARLPEPSSPIVIGVWSRSPFGDELDKLVAGRQVNGRPIVVKTVATAADAGSAHLLFVPDGEEQNAELAALLATRPAIVVVGESARFAALAGTITFVTEADKVRFTVDLETADRAGLKLSAQLLKLASRVHRKS